MLDNLVNLILAKYYTYLKIINDIVDHTEQSK